jgi:hypothetical protein
MIEWFRQDEKWTQEQGWTKQRRESEIAYKRRVALRQAAQAAVERLNRCNDPDLSERGLSQDVQDELVALYQRSAKSLPSWRLRHDLAAYFSRRYRAMKDNSPSIAEAVSDFGDYTTRRSPRRTAMCSRPIDGSPGRCARFVSDSPSLHRSRRGRTLLLLPT